MSRPFSRSMHPLPEAEWTWVNRAAVALVVVPLLVAVSPLVLLLHLWHEPRWQRHKARLVAERLGDPLCTFARSFDRRAVDPYVIRAVWDEMQGHLGEKNGPFPVRATDDWASDLWGDPEEMEDIIVRVARRSRHSLVGWERNPWVQRARTVGDLVHLVNAQPRTEAVCRDA